MCSHFVTYALIGYRQFCLQLEQTTCSLYVNYILRLISLTASSLSNFASLNISAFSLEHPFSFKMWVSSSIVSRTCAIWLESLFWLFLTTFTFHFRLSRSLAKFHFVIYTDAFAIRRYIERVFLGTGNYIFNNEIYTTFYDFTLIWDSLLSVNTRFRLKYVESLYEGIGFVRTIYFFFIPVRPESVRSSYRSP